MKQSIHHPNVDCVHGHLERESFDPVCKKMAIFFFFYKYPLLLPPPFLENFGGGW